MEKEVQLVELVGDQSPSLKAAPTRSRRGGSKEDVTEGTMEKSRHVRVIERKEMRRDDTNEYFLPKGVRSTF